MVTYLSLQTMLYSINCIKQFVSIPRVKTLVSGYAGREPLLQTFS